MNGAGGRALKFMAVLFIAGGGLALLYVVKLRFDTGDSLPKGSSLRSDPLGVEVLFESINSSGIAVAERNYFTLESVPLDNCDMIVLSHAAPPLRGKVAAALENFVTNHGGRLLFTLEPRNRAGPGRKEPARDFKEKTDETDEDGQSDGPDEPEGGRGRKRDADEGSSGGTEDGTKERSCPGGGCAISCDATASNRLWRSFGTIRMEGACTNAFLNAAYDRRGYDLPEAVPVRTLLGLSTNLLDDGWQAVYSCSGMPVVVERRWERGSVVISSLSYPFSNEAMRGVRQTEFLLWALDGSRKVLFDESHFGLVVSRTVAKLIRKNNLHYAILALLVPVILYFRLATVTLLPRFDGDEHPAERFDAGAGNALSRLLMRSVPPANLVSAALDKWYAENQGALTALPEEERESLEETLSKYHDASGRFSREKDILKAWNEIVELLRAER